MGVKPADPGQIGRSGDALGHARHEEQVGLHDDVVDQIEDRAHQAERRVQRQPQHHVADLADDVEGQDAAEVVHRRRAQNAGDHGHHRQPQQQRMGEAHILIEDQREHADQRIDPHLGQQARKDRGHRNGRCVIGGRQPEEQREECRLDAEGHHEHHRDGGQQAGILDPAHGQMQVCHVQRAGDAVEEADPRQEHDGRDQVQQHVLDAAVQLLARAAQHQEAEAGDQHDLEPDIEVEQVARQEGPADAHQQGLQQGVEAETLQPLGDFRQRIDDGGQAGDGGDDHHDAAQQVGGQGDAEGRVPAGHLRGQDALVQDLGHQHQAGQQQRRGARDRDPAPGDGVAEQIAQHRRHHRDEDRIDQKPAHIPASCPVAGFCGSARPRPSLPVSRSVPSMGSAIRISSLLTVPRVMKVR